MIFQVWLMIVLQALKILARPILFNQDFRDPNHYLGQPYAFTRRNDKYINFEHPKDYYDSLYPNAYESNRVDDYEAAYLPRVTSPRAKRCSSRLENALEHIRRRQRMANSKELDRNSNRGNLNLTGYSLHQQLRSIPYDMYVTDMRVRLPPSDDWVRVEKCQFNPRNKSLETRLMFNDLTISGNVNLFKEDDIVRQQHDLDGATYPSRYPKLADTCGMILRLRKAGIGFYTEPIQRNRGQLNIKTDSYFMEPGFISVYAYGCDPKPIANRRKGQSELDVDDKDIVSKEMETIFLKGIRSLLTTYMQKELQPAIKETLMTNLGYTISYGKR